MLPVWRGQLPTGRTDGERPLSLTEGVQAAPEPQRQPAGLSAAAQRGDRL